MSGLRRSKLRNVAAEYQRDKRLRGLRVSVRALESQGIAASHFAVAYPWDIAGGVIGVVYTSQLSEGVRQPATLQLRGSRNLIQDLQFSPHYDDILAAASDDCGVRLWRLPSVEEGEAMKPNESRWVSHTCEFMGHERKALVLDWNPRAGSILASGGQDGVVNVWDASTGQQCHAVTMKEPVQFIDWNESGSLLAVAARDKKIYVCDPREPNSIVQEFNGHEGAKGTKFTWLGGIRPAEQLFTAGAQKGPGREAWLMDTRNFTKPLWQMDTGKGSASLIPVFDPDTGLLCLPARGESGCSVLDLSLPDVVESLYSFRSLESTMGFAFAPKRSVDVMRREIARMYRVEGVGGASCIQTVAFIVPRRSLEFQDDLYPPTFSGKPSLTAIEWRAKAVLPVPPIEVVSLDPAEVPVQVPRYAGAADICCTVQPTASSPPRRNSAPAPSEAAGGAAPPVNDQSVPPTTRQTTQVFETESIRGQNERLKLQVEALQRELNALRATSEVYSLKQENARLRAEAEDVQRTFAKMFRVLQRAARAEEEEEEEDGEPVTSAAVPQPPPAGPTLLPSCPSFTTSFPSAAGVSKGPLTTPTLSPSVPTAPVNPLRQPSVPQNDMPFPLHHSKLINSFATPLALISKPMAPPSQVAEEPSAPQIEHHTASPQDSTTNADITRPQGVPEPPPTKSILEEPASKTPNLTESPTAEQNMAAAVSVDSARHDSSSQRSESGEGEMNAHQGGENIDNDVVASAGGLQGNAAEDGSTGEKMSADSRRLSSSSASVESDSSAGSATSPVVQQSAEPLEPAINDEADAASGRSSLPQEERGAIEGGEGIEEQVESSEGSPQKPQHQSLDNANASIELSESSPKPLTPPSVADGVKFSDLVDDSVANTPLVRRAVDDASSPNGVVAEEIMPHRTLSNTDFAHLVDESAAPSPLLVRRPSSVDSTLAEVQRKLSAQSKSSSTDLSRERSSAEASAPADAGGETSAASSRRSSETSQGFSSNAASDATPSVRLIHSAASSADKDDEPLSPSSDEEAAVVDSLVRRVTRESMGRSPSSGSPESSSEKAANVLPSVPHQNGQVGSDGEDEMEAAGFHAPIMNRPLLPPPRPVLPRPPMPRPPVRAPASAFKF